MEKSYIYSQVKVFHFPEKINSLPVDRVEIRPPVHVRIKPTNRCNQHCYYCSYREDNLQLGKGMNLNDIIPKEKLFEIAEDLGEMGTKAVTLSRGGEPLTHPHILELLRRIVSTSKLKFAFITNGINLKGEVADLIASHGSWIRISVDGWDDKSYSEYRHVPAGQWSRLIENIKRFSGMRGKCLLGVYIIVDDKNAVHTYDMIRLYKELGANSVKVYGVVLSDDGSANNSYHEKIYHDVREQIDKAKMELEDEAFQVYDAYHFQSGNFKKGYNWCPYIQITPVIGADLKVYSCHDKAYTEGGLLGDIRYSRFRDFWMQGKEKFFRICPENDCNHHCMVNQQNKTIVEYLNIYSDHLEFL